MNADELLSAASADQLLVMAANAIVGRGADMATAQVVVRRRGALVLVAAVGFEHPFVEHFAVVDDDTSMCGRALRERTVVMVPDVAADPVLDGSESRAVLLQAGSRSCASFPLLDTERAVIGVVSAHQRTPGPHDLAPIREVVDEVQRRLAAARPVEDDDLRVAALENLQLRQALSTRGLIGVAKGLLMASSTVDEEEAFRLLVRASQRQNVRLRDVCARIVEGHHRRIPRL